MMLLAVVGGLACDVEVDGWSAVVVVLVANPWRLGPLDPFPVSEDQRMSVTPRATKTHIAITVAMASLRFLMVLRSYFSNAGIPWAIVRRTSSPAGQHFVKDLEIGHPDPAYRVRFAFCLFAKGLINRYGSHMKATGTNLRRVSNWRVRFLSLEILVPSIIILILDNSDVSRGRSWDYLSFRRLSQLLELTLLPTSLEGATP